MGRRRANYSSLSSSSSTTSSSSSDRQEVAFRRSSSGAKLHKSTSSGLSSSRTRQRHTTKSDASHARARYRKSSRGKDSDEEFSKKKGSSKSPRKGWSVNSVYIPALIVCSFVVSVALAIFLYPKSSEGYGITTPAPVYKYLLMGTYQHDYQSFTQGLAYDDNEPGVLYESTGLFGKSSVRRVHALNGSTFKMSQNVETEFGEGLTFFGAKKHQLVQVLWKTGRGNVFDRYTLEHLYSFEGDDLKDGWGIAQVPERPDCFYLSDGTDRIRMFQLNPETRTATAVDEVFVKDAGVSVALLNELEMVRGELWANILFAQVVARIDPKTGRVVGWLDLRGVLDPRSMVPNHKVDVMNGLAYSEELGHVYVTGKLWPAIMTVVPLDQQYAQDIMEAGVDAFFMNKDKVKYVLDHMLA